MKTKFLSESLRPFINFEGLKGTEEVERKQYTSDIVVMPDEEKTIVARISTVTLDGDEDIVIPSGADFSRFAKNPVIHADHSYKVEDVVGKAVELGVDNKGIIAKIRFADTPRANDAWKLIKGGFVKANSIGFIIKNCVYKGTKEFNEFIKKSGMKVTEACSRIVTEYELLESSIVSVPCNPDALVSAISTKNITLTPKTLEMMGLKALSKESKESKLPNSVSNVKSETTETTTETEIAAAIATGDIWANVKSEVVTNGNYGVKSEAKGIEIIESPQGTQGTQGTPKEPVNEPNESNGPNTAVTVTDTEPAPESPEAPGAPRTISVVSTPPKRYIRVSRSIKVVRPPLDVRKEAYKRVMQKLAKQGRIL